MKRLASMLIVVAWSAVWVGGCATANTVADARASLEKAQVAGAQEKVPSDYYMAEAYYDRAEHEAKEGDRKEAETYAEKSIKYSEQAIQKTKGGAK